MSAKKKVTRPDTRRVRARVCVYACVSLSVVIAAPLTRFGRTMGRMAMKSMRRVLGHSLVRSLVHSHRTLIRLLRTARFARPLSRTGTHGKEIFVHELNALISCSFNPLCTVSEQPKIGTSKFTLSHELGSG